MKTHLHPELNTDINAQRYSEGKNTGRRRVPSASGRDNIAWCAPVLSTVSLLVVGHAENLDRAVLE